LQFTNSLPAKRLNDMNKDAYTKAFLQAAEIPVTEKTIKEYKAVWWWSFRNKKQGGLRLTDQALKFIEEYAKIKTYKIEFPKEFAFTPQVLLWLDNYIDSPFFVNKKHIIVMKEKAAFELYLLSGDVRKLGHNRAMSKRLSQESTPE
jgi:hypothetical protein